MQRRRGTTFIDDIKTARQGDEEIKETTYEREIVSAVDCYGMDFQSVTFDGCRFIECDFGKASFYDCKFLRCDLSNCKLPDSYWKGCEINDCKCNGADFSNSVVKQTALKSSSFAYGLFSEGVFESSTLSSCDFSNALLSEVAFKRTKFSECRFIRAELFQTGLKGIDLSDCDISGIALSDSFLELRGAVVSYDQAAELALLLGVKIK